MKPLLFLFALLAAWPARGAAADQPRNVSIRFTVVSWEPLSRVLYRAQGADVEITLPAFSPSPIFNYTGPAELHFFRRDPAAAPGKDIPFADVVIPPGCARFLLLFSAATGGGAQVLPLPVSDEAFPLGHARVFNATSAPVAVKCPSGVFELAPAGFKEVTGNGRFLHIEVARKTAGSWEKAFNSMFELNATMRRTIFITASAALLTRSAEGASPHEPLQVFTLQD